MAISFGNLPEPFPDIRFSRPAAYAPLIASGVWGDSRGGGTRFHQGIDIVMPMGTPVLAMAPGKVYTARLASDPTGIFVGIQHQNGWASRYMHLDSVAVQKGEMVKRGQIIGYAGITGGVRTPHLHLSILLDKSRLGDFARVYGEPTTGWGNAWSHGTAVPGEPIVPLDGYEPDALERMHMRNVLPYQGPPQRKFNTAKWLVLGFIAIAAGVSAFVWAEKQ